MDQCDHPKQICRPCLGGGKEEHLSVRQQATRPQGPLLLGEETTPRSMLFSLLANSLKYILALFELSNTNTLTTKCSTLNLNNLIHFSAVHIYP